MWKLVFLLAISWCAVAENNTDQDRASILELHSMARGNVTPSASNMQLLRYSLVLENLAQQWTANCSNKLPNSTLLPNHPNIAVTWISVQSRKPFYYEVLPLFNNYFREYTYENNSCRGNCRLYIQYVWANTTEVGCGMSRCDKGNENPNTPSYLVACAYYPAENIGNLRPYANGSSCSACPDGFFCHRNQCTNDTSLLPNTTTPSSTTGTAINTTTTDIGTSTSDATTTTSIFSEVSMQGILYCSLIQLFISA
uniref:SCP domain-containing protein n=1 Tax=Mesocestoides corti TaxID=53468 RepID=A0A5K3FW08_MESCO